jgi:hypothetical protein
MQASSHKGVRLQSRKSSVTEIPTIIDPSAIIKYPSATGVLIIVGISVQVVWTDIKRSLPRAEYLHAAPQGLTLTAMRFAHGGLPNLASFVYGFARSRIVAALIHVQRDAWSSDLIIFCSMVQVYEAHLFVNECTKAASSAQCLNARTL